MDATTLDSLTAEMELVSIFDIHRSPENDDIYKRVDPTDPEIVTLAESIRERGILEPLVISKDGYILSGHRRYAAAELADLEWIPCRRSPVSRVGNRDEFVRLLVEYNRQREKTKSEKLREEIVCINPDEAYGAMTQYRRSKSQVAAKQIVLTAVKRRARISKAKKPMLDAVIKAVNARRSFWPATVRQIHYDLLNDPPLLHAKKEKRYGSNQTSYKSLCNLLSRARLEGLVPMSAISDETRPVCVWNTHATPKSFVREELSEMFLGYWRNLQQAQPNHIEIVAEKNTVSPAIRPVAEKYCIPMTTGRGYCSLPPREAIAERFRASGKEKLVLLLISDFDADGEVISESFARSMRDDFHIAEHRLHAIKVALTWDQVKKFKLPPSLFAKKQTARSRKFIKKYGEHAWELEALRPEKLQQIVDDAVNAVIDQDAFEEEVQAERQDSVFLNGVRARVVDALKGLDLEGTAI